MNERNAIRIGVIGAGSMGTTHARAIGASVTAARIVAVADVLADSAERLAHELGVQTVHADALELIHDDRVDAVLIASPGETHEQLVLACLQAGKPVLCEKPLARSPQSARRVLQVEAARGRRLVQVGFMRRFDPGYAELKAELDRGGAGEPLIVYSTHRNPSAPPGFGSELIVKDTVVHDVDTVRWLLGHELVKATVFTPRPTSKAPAGVRDPLIVLFETDHASHVHVEAFVNARYGYDIRCEIVGETGTLALAPPATVLLQRDGRAGVDVPMRFQDRFGSAYVRELQGWVSSIADGTPVGASAWDGYAASVVCEAAWRSLTTGEPAAVQLGDKPDLYAGRGRVAALSG